MSDDMTKALRTVEAHASLAAQEWDRDDSEEARKHMRRARLALTEAFDMFRMYEREATRG